MNGLLYVGALLPRLLPSCVVNDVAMSCQCLFAICLHKVVSSGTDLGAVRDG